ncbi:hypothetical protein N7470_006519 [Penicillium chermesinum]|nr:hypothetical protein N7470_006519 [Penicillium chermesinum]
MASYLVTGASRGLGSELVTQLAAKPVTEVRIVFAAARSSNPQKLEELAAASNGRVQLVRLDVGVKESAQEAANEVEKKLQGEGLDYLINNAGVMDYHPNGLEGMDTLDEVFHTNVTAVHYVTQAFLPLLRKGKKIVINISTTLGAFSKVHIYQPMPSPAYTVTKAALNMLGLQYAYKYKDEGFTFLAISPGWLRTDLGSQYADLPVEVGAEKTLDIIQRAGPEVNGKFWNIQVDGWEEPRGQNKNQYDGKEVAW